MSSQSLKEKTTTNFLWGLAERSAAQGVTFVVSIILARLLGPDAYGTLALVTIFITLLNVFVDSGLGTALIQKKNVDDLDFSTVFFFNLGLCAALYVLLFFAAPLVSLFYERPELTSVIRVLGTTLLFSGLRNTQKAYVSRNMIFKKFFWTTIVSTVGSAVVGVAMAYLGYGVWALVGQQISNTVIVTIMLWLTVKWRPKLMFSFERLKGLFSYGWKLLISALVDTLYVDLRQLIIGKKYSAEDLACYNKGDHFPKFVALNINSSIDGVLFPVLSSQQNNRERVKAMTRKSIKISTFVVAPLMIGLAVCARPVVQLLLGDQWLGCVLFMQILCISYLFYPIHTANLNAVKAMGRSDYFLKLEIVKKAVGLAALFSTMWISVEAMVYSLLATTVISTMINAFPNKKLLQYSWFEQMRDILPILALAAGMGAVVYCLNFLPLPTIAVLALQIVTGGVIYIGISVLLKLEIFTYLWGTAKEILKRRKQH